MFTLVGLVFWLLALVIAITVHEFSHAYVADKMGDPTPRMMGRLSLNPMAHYDRVGTTMLLVTVIMRAFGAPVIPFGWAKPVQFDPYNLKNPRRDAALISLAGPASNVIVAILFSIVLRLMPVSVLGNIFQLVLVPIILLNVVLALFNLVPIHPLDGGKILIGFLPKELAYEAEKVLRQYGLLILIFLIIPINGTSPIFSLIGPVIDFAINLLIP
jgi:Zn-dependent protease